MDPIKSDSSVHAQSSLQVHKTTASSPSTQVSLSKLKESSSEGAASLQARIVTPHSAEKDWQDFNLTKQQLDELQMVAKVVISPLYRESEREGEDQIFTGIRHITPIELENGQVLHPIEIAAIMFYTLDGFKVMNGSFDHDESIKDFMVGRDIPEANFEEIKKAGKLLSRIAASGLNKLPPTSETTVFRGDAIPENKFNETAAGTKIVMNRFTSTSVKEGVADHFAMSSASTRGGVTVIYAIENPSRAKNIEVLSQVSFQKESERIYAPHQTFEVTRTEIEEVPITEDITGDDAAIEKAKAEGTLIEKISPKGKQKFYIQTGAEAVRKIYLKETV